MNGELLCWWMASITLMNYRTLKAPMTIKLTSWLSISKVVHYLLWAGNFVEWHVDQCIELSLTLHVFRAYGIFESEVMKTPGAMNWMGQQTVSLTTWHFVHHGSCADWLWAPLQWTIEPWRFHWLSCWQLLEIGTWGASHRGDGMTLRLENLAQTTVNTCSSLYFQQQLDFCPS